MDCVFPANDQCTFVGGRNRPNGWVSVLEMESRAFKRVKAPVATDRTLDVVAQFFGRYGNEYRWQSRHEQHPVLLADQQHVRICREHVVPGYERNLFENTTGAPSAASSNEGFFRTG